MKEWYIDTSINEASREKARSEIDELLRSK